jgi:hypothetical protein
MLLLFLLQRHRLLHQPPSSVLLHSQNSSSLADERETTVDPSIGLVPELQALCPVLYLSSSQFESN